jgi:hypothetical protein
LSQFKHFFIALLIASTSFLIIGDFNDISAADTDPKDHPAKIRYDPSDPSYKANLTKFSYILYYGSFTDQITSHILSASPTLLITNYYAMNSDIRSDFGRNNVSIIAYVPIQWTQRDLGSALAEINQLLDDGADGIFIDEASTVSNDWELWYHYQLFDAVKRAGDEKIVVINPGTVSLSEDAMLVSDIICFEHDWRNIKNVEWMSNYPGWRFMAISSNEFVNVMGYHVNAQTARQDLDEARLLNIAYQYSADHYIWLPPWLDVYGGHSNSLHPTSPYIELDLASPERPSNYYPVVDTVTDEVGNDHDVIIVDKDPDNPDVDNNTSVRPDINATSPDISDEDTDPPEQEDPDVVQNRDNLTDDDWKSEQANMTEVLDNADEQSLVVKQRQNMTYAANITLPVVAGNYSAGRDFLNETSN